MKKNCCSFKLNALTFDYSGNACNYSAVFVTSNRKCRSHLGTPRWPQLIAFSTMKPKEHLLKSSKINLLRIRRFFCVIYHKPVKLSPLLHHCRLLLLGNIVPRRPFAISSVSLSPYLARRSFSSRRMDTLPGKWDFN